MQPRLALLMATCRKSSTRRLWRWWVACGVALACRVAGGSPAYVNVPAGSFDSVLSAGSGVNVPVSVAAFQMRERPVTIGEFLAFTQQQPAWRRGQVPALFADGTTCGRSTPPRHKTPRAPISR